MKEFKIIILYFYGFLKSVWLCSCGAGILATTLYILPKVNNFFLEYYTKYPPETHTQKIGYDILYSHEVGAIWFFFTGFILGIWIIAKQGYKAYIFLSGGKRKLVNEK